MAGAGGVHTASTLIVIMAAVRVMLIESATRVDSRKYLTRAAQPMHAPPTGMVLRRAGSVIGDGLRDRPDPRQH